ncbi:hypothetical protein TD95_001966 [Thielaviopsis punctulata]|uniref:Necrosis-and ethylene-inducing protein 1 n=1 Tax=Thielaviopsis punctulata TaxID=72032 RepID=A0A0F4ZBF8_9PEZI|nr:hypothetical protein TD95_001966 [Thielaviopsis punctulata]
MHFTTLSAFLFAVTGAIAAPVSDADTPRLAARDIIDHDKVVALPETIPNDKVGSAYKKFQPWLRTVGDGCWSYPAVDKDGNTSGGLAVSGRPSGGCRESSGQVYVRSAAYNDRYAIMYSWYMPKDQGTSGLGLIGHRHEWEDIVVWIDSIDAAEPTMVGISASAHGGYNKYNSPPEGLFQEGTSRPFIKYYQDVAFFGTHSLDTDDALGGEQPMVQYEMMPEPARQALETTDFGDANFPMRNDRFTDQLAKAWPF